MYFNVGACVQFPALECSGPHQLFRKPQGLETRAMKPLGPGLNSAVRYPVRTAAEALPGLLRLHPLALADGIARKRGSGEPLRVQLQSPCLPARHRRVSVVTLPSTGAHL